MKRTPSKHMGKPIRHSVRNVYNYSVSKIIDVKNWLPSLRKKSALLLIDKELDHLKLRVTDVHISPVFKDDLHRRIKAIRYLLKKL